MQLRDGHLFHHITTFTFNDNCKTKPAAWIGPQKVGKTMANKDYHEIMTEITSQLTGDVKEL